MQKSTVHHIDKDGSAPDTLEVDFSFDQACTKMHPTPEILNIKISILHYNLITCVGRNRQQT